VRNNDIDEIMIDGNEITIDTETAGKRLVSSTRRPSGQLFIITDSGTGPYSRNRDPLIISQGASPGLRQGAQRSRTWSRSDKDDDKDRWFQGYLQLRHRRGILKKIKLPKAAERLINSIKRVRISELILDKKFLVGRGEYLDDKRPPATALRSRP
jgi:hypothetical protein